MKCGKNEGPVFASGKHLCGVWKKGVVYCGSCKHWVHKRCSGFKGRLIDTPYFKCHKGLHLPGSEKEAHKFKLSNSEYKRMDKFCNLGDMLRASAGADASSVTQIRTSWKKFRELLPLFTSRVFSHKMKGNIHKACVRSAMLYGSETWPLKVVQTPMDRNADG